MLSIVIGSLDRAFATVSVTTEGDWQVTLHKGARRSEAIGILDRVYARVQREHGPLTHAQFVEVFYRPPRGGLKGAVSLTAWAHPVATMSRDALMRSMIPGAARYLDLLKEQQQQRLEQDKQNKRRRSARSRDEERPRSSRRRD